MYLSFSQLPNTPEPTLTQYLPSLTVSSSLHSSKQCLYTFATLSGIPTCFNAVSAKASSYMYSSVDGKFI